MSYMTTIELANNLGGEAIKELLRWKAGVEQGLLTFY